MSRKKSIVSKLPCVYNNILCLEIDNIIVEIWQIICDTFTQGLTAFMFLIIVLFVVNTNYNRLQLSNVVDCAYVEVKMEIKLYV